MKTTVEIRDDLLRRAKEAARKERTTLRALVEEGLQRVVEARAVPGRRRRFRMAPFKGDGLQPGLDYRDWKRILEICYEGRGG